MYETTSTRVNLPTSSPSFCSYRNTNEMSITRTKFFVAVEEAGIHSAMSAVLRIILHASDIRVRRWRLFDTQDSSFYAPELSIASAEDR